MLMKLEGFMYASSLDLNMGYYHIDLSPDSKKLCTIVFLWVNLSTSDYPAPGQLMYQVIDLDSATWMFQKSR